MNIRLKMFLTVVVVSMLSSCSHSASPQFIRGNYYMTGDSSCRFSRPRTDTSINCYNSDDEPTGYRNAMTDQELSMYQHRQTMNAMQAQTNATNRQTLDQGWDEINANTRALMRNNGY